MDSQRGQWGTIVGSTQRADDSISTSNVHFGCRVDNRLKEVSQASSESHSEVSLSLIRVATVVVVVVTQHQ